MTKLMKDVFELPVSAKGYMVMATPYTPLLAVEEYISEIECDNGIDAEYVAHAINSHDTLTEQNKQLVEALTDISNMCIGEIAMGYKLDAQSIGEIIYKATGKTNPELNEVVAKHKEQI